MLAGLLLTVSAFLLVWLKVQHLLFLRKWDHLPGERREILHVFSLKEICDIVLIQFNCICIKI